MSRGKYSVRAYIDNSDDMNYNAKGQRMPEGFQISKGFDPETDWYVYDHEGYDRYGYSSYTADGKFDDGHGVDRAGWTEDDYSMGIDD